MAEPTKKFEDQTPPGNADSAPYGRSDLNALEKEGDTTQPAGDWYSAYSPKATGEPEELNEAEQNGGDLPQHENIVGQGYKPGAGEHHTPSLRTRLLRSNKRKAILGGSIVAIIVTAIIVAFLALIPLKILHIVNNLQSRFFATSQNAVEKQVDKLFSKYIYGKITAGCRGAYIDSSCNPYKGTSLVSKLYRGWSDGRLEEKLRSQTGLEIRKNKAGIYEMKFSDNDLISLEDLKKDKTIAEIIDAKGDWTEVKKSQIRSIYKSALKSTTRYPNAMYYLKVTPYLARKYGIKWCVIGCDKKDTFEKWKNRHRIAAKMWLAERVLGPRAEMYSMIMKCLYAPDVDCKKDNVLNATPKDYEADIEGCKKGCIDGGRPVSPALTNMEARLVTLAIKFGSDYDTLKKYFDLFEKNGFIAGIFKSWTKSRVNDEGNSRGESKLDGNRDLADQVNQRGANEGMKIPATRVLGWMVMAAYLVEFLDDMPEVIIRYQYAVNTTSMVQMWGMYRVVPDEVKEGETHADLMGSFNSSFSPGLQPNEGNGEQVGGTAGAEASPLYIEIISNGPYKEAGVASLLKSAFLPNAAALENEETQTNSDAYICKNGSPPPAGQLICDEEKLNSKNWFLAAWSKLDLGLITDAAKVITGVIDGILGEIFKLLGKIPFFNDLINAIGRLVSNVISYTGLGELFIRMAELMLGLNLNMVNNNMSGARTFNLVAGGADVSGNDFAHHGIGGVALKPEQVAQNLDYFYNHQLAEHRQKSLFAQVFDTKSPYSTVSRLALTMPSNFNSALYRANSAFASFIKNPFGKLANSFASIFTIKTSAAGFIPGKDPFGITQYGYPLDDPIFKQDPDQYWQKYCVSTLPDGSSNPNFLTQKWNQYAADNLNPENFEPENYQTEQFRDMGSPYGTNGCLLIQTAVASAGGIFTDDVLSAEELAEYSASSGSFSVGPVDCNAQSNLDQSPGDISTVPAQYLPLIAAAAPDLSCPNYTKPKGAFPDTPGKQYFASCSDNCGIQGLKDGKRFIRVKYRNPPLAGNTIDVFIDP